MWQKRLVREKRRLVTANDYRRQAREIMREIYPDIDWHMHYVHHADCNPFNNSIENLIVIHRQEHVFLHSMIKKHNLR